VRVLGIDFGTTRIGLAVSDPTGTFASPLCTVGCTERRRDLVKLKDIIERNDAEHVVVGLPVTLKGEVGPAAEAAAEFARQLAEQIDVPVTTWDERMTTVVAERALLESGMRRESRRDNRDKVAAAVMLQSYLDAQANR
jgi:putative Holliday junction resolvase